MSKAVASWKRGIEARMTRMSLVLCWLCLAAPMGASDDGYAPLWLYQGKWQLKTNGQEKADTIANECKRVGKYFACEQAVNGKVESLIVFVPAETPKHYYTQGVLSDGRATGRAALEIDGDHWTYQSQEQEGGNTTYYRTTNLFSGRDHIHFEQLQSSDGAHWNVTSTGEEARMR
jgi:hypothetical protein